MPSHPITTQTRFGNAKACLTTSVATLEALSDAFKTPFLEPISKTTQLLLAAVETIKQNKADCTQLLEQTHQLLDAVLTIYIQPDAESELPLDTLNHLGKFTETLYKILTYIEALQDRSWIKQFFRQGEMNALLRECKAGLQETLDFFKVQTVNYVKDVADMKKHAEKKHQEVVELIEALSDTSISDEASSTNIFFSSPHHSTNSISMLPSQPKIFHGRETELSDLLRSFIQETPRIAILGAGGMGKTTLARTILHHPDISTRYGEHRLFIACDTTSTELELAMLIALHLGLKTGKNIIETVVEHLASCPPCLLILDNLETLWEPKEFRTNIEEFLSLLSDLAHVAMIITMRGAERPSNICWTRPFLEPLKPLRQDAARQTFLDIADDGYTISEVDKVLLLTDNLPLAIDLIAHLVASEGCSNVLSRWEQEKTSVISQGQDKRSNLEISISLSLSSSRITSDSKDLLSLLSRLPEGLSNTELLRSKLPIDDILSNKAALLRTSLAYTGDHNRVKILSPVQQYMQKYYPAGHNLLEPLLKYFYELLNIFHGYEGSLISQAFVSQIRSNFSNIKALLLDQLQHHQNSEIIDAIYSTCYLDRFSVLTGGGRILLMDLIPNLLVHAKDPRLNVYFISQVFNSWRYHPVDNADILVEQGLKIFPDFDDADLKCDFYNNITG